jgi:hypothetical protein
MLAGLFAGLVGADLLGIAGTAHAVLPPVAVEEMKAEATAHLQAQVVDLKPGIDPVGTCATELAVRRIFRDTTATLRPGRQIHLDIRCLRPPRPGESQQGPPPGGASWIAQADLHPGKFLEAYLFAEGGGWTLRSGALVWPIADPGATPAH